jgi:hypothetical protein
LDFYFFAIPAVILIGLSKGGFAGLGAVGVPIMALGSDPLTSAAILLPILIVQDAVGVASFWKTWDGRILLIMLPGAIAGVILGYFLAAKTSIAGLTISLGLLSIVFGIRQLWVGRGGRLPATSNPRAWVGSIFGLITGFTSQIGHAGGPPFQMWVMPQRLPRDVFVGTGAIFFAILNWIKVPAYVALDQFSRANILATLSLLPVAILASFAGIHLVRKVSVERFYTIIYGLMVVAGGKLLWDGWTF